MNASKRLFDRYLIVDWSASEKIGPKKKSPNQIWIGYSETDFSGSAVYFRDRKSAVAALATDFRKAIAERARLFVGLDFGFGYPAGAITYMGAADWKQVWKLLAGKFALEQKSAGLRFDVANELNRDLFGSDGPFWRHKGKDPEDRKNNGKNAFKRVYSNLPFSKPDFSEFSFGFEERRICERNIPRAKSQWELLNPGSVGSQSLLGMSALFHLLEGNDFWDSVAVWPFETDFEKNLSKPITIGEIYPSAFTICGEFSSEEITDENQVMTLAHGFHALDQQNRFKELLSRPKNLSDEDYKLVVKEEGWIVGLNQQFSLLVDAIASSNLSAVANKKLSEFTDYIRDPSEIYRQSFATVEEEAKLDRLPKSMHPVATRLIHSCGMVDIIDDLAFSENAVDAGVQALGAEESKIYCDVEMVKSGIIRKFLPDGCELICTLNDEKAPEYAKEIGNTRSAAAVDFWDGLEGSIVVIGNAPTALFRLLERIADGAPKPALVIGIPVGFVGAVESKQALAENDFGLEYITVHGRRGGSAMASSVLNALAGGLS